MNMDINFNGLKITTLLE